MAYTAQAGLAIGHAHQKVTDLVRSIAFYRDLISQEAQQRRGTDAAFLSAAGHHHHIGLNIRRGGGGPQPDAGAPGLFHAAFLCPARAELARAVANALARGVALTGASGHGVSGAVHLAILTATGSNFTATGRPPTGRGRPTARRQ